MNFAPFALPLSSREPVSRYLVEQLAKEALQRYQACLGWRRRSCSGTFRAVAMRCLTLQKSSLFLPFSLNFRAISETKVCGKYELHLRTYSLAIHHWRTPFFLGVPTTFRQRLRDVLDPPRSFGSTAVVPQRARKANFSLPVLYLDTVFSVRGICPPSTRSRRGSAEKNKTVLEAGKGNRGAESVNSRAIDP